MGQWPKDNVDSATLSRLDLFKSLDSSILLPIFSLVFPVPLDMISKPTKDIVSIEETKNEDDVFITAQRPSTDPDTKIEGYFPGHADTSLDEEHTLTAFGDISLSEIDFVPGLASALPPVRKTRQENKLSTGPESSENVDDRSLPIVVRKILPPGPAKKSLRKPKLSFEEMVLELKKAREDSKSSDTLPASNLDLHVPQPSRLADLKNIGIDAVIAKAFGSHDGVQNSASPKPTVTAKQCAAVADENEASPVTVGTIKKSKKNGLRGNAKLPKRPPLPRWGDDDDDVAEAGNETNGRRHLGLAILCEGLTKLARIFKLGALFIRLRDTGIQLMNRNLGRYVVEEEMDWEIVPFKWWQTSFTAVSWSYNPKHDCQGTNSPRRHYQGSLFLVEGSRRRSSSLPIVLPPSALSKEHRISEEEEELNVNLVGVKTAMEAVMAYEGDVGFHFSNFPDLGLQMSPLDGVDLSVDIDEKDIQVGKDQWCELLEDLMNGPAFENTTDSDESLESSFVGSISSYGSTDSVPMPSTPKPKSFFNDIEIKGTSPTGSLNGSRSHSSNFSPSRSLSAAASSFVPTFCPQLNEEPLQFASSQESQSPPDIYSPSASFSSFTFPTLNPTTPPSVKIKKDEQGFFTDVQIESSSTGASKSDLLPPFLQEPSQRNRSRKSRTREIVDRLRSQTAPEDASSSPHLDLGLISPKYASHSPSPTGDDANVMKPRLSVSEDGGDRPSRLSTPWDDDDGWIDITQPSAISADEQKSKRTRELFLALTRRRTDSSSSGDFKEVASGTAPGPSHPRNISVSASVSPSPSPSPHKPSASNLPSSNSDGWIESKPRNAPPPDPQKKPKASSPSLPSHSKDMHSRKRSSHHNARSSISSSVSSHVPQQQPFFNANSSCYPQLSPVAQPHPHMLSPSTAAFPYFLPAYPAVAMPSPYATAFMQIPSGYPMAMAMHGAAHIIPTAGTVVHPLSGMSYVTPALMPVSQRGGQASTKYAANMTPTTTSSTNMPSSRAKHSPLW